MFGVFAPEITEPVRYILLTLMTVYTLSVAIFILLDNRSPQSTFAWFFLFFIFPVGGVLLYILFGRSWKAFSRESKLAKQRVGQYLSKALAPLMARQEEEIEKLKLEGHPSYKKLIQLLRRNSYSVLTIHNRLEILQNADQKYPRLIEDILQAHHSIHLEYYIWASDPFTERLKQILINKVKQGVEVRILYDPIGSFLELSPFYVRSMRAGGVKMVPFSSIYKFHTIGYRNHRKIAVIDGKIGYAGALNISQQHLDGPRGFTAWRDTHLRLTGEAVRILQATFITDWFNATYEDLSGDCYFPPVEEEKNLYLPIHILNAGPDSRWQAVRQLYFFMILAAEHHVYIQSPFFILDESISEALKAAALSGVDVKVMVAPRGPGNPLPYWAGYTYIHEMARAGVRIFFYQKGYFHPKTIVIDGAFCSVGSGNMDIRSFSINYETNSVIYDKKVAQQLEQDFLKDLESCTEFDLRVYQANPFGRLRDSFARLFSPLL
jgi:cardiolipin synthase